MSAYIVNDETINKIIEALRYATQYNRIYPNPIYADRENETLVIRTRERAKELGQEMREMNERAIIARYDEKSIDEFTGGESYTWKIVAANGRIRAFKSLQCFLYQCSEGNVPQEPLFQCLEKYKNMLAVSIVSDMPEYDKAPWG